MQIKMTANEEIKSRVLAGLKENGGYCPCSIIRDATTKCPCKDFREQSEGGACHCGLYYKR